MIQAHLFRGSERIDFNFIQDQLLVRWLRSGRPAQENNYNSWIVPDWIRIYELEKQLAFLAHDWHNGAFSWRNVLVAAKWRM